MSRSAAMPCGPPTVVRRRSRPEVVKAYEKVDPVAVLPIHQRLVENELVDAGAQHYRLAARRLARTRKLAAGSEHAAEVDELIADLRETHRRRPRLQQEFDRAGLPRDALDAGIAEDLAELAAHVRGRQGRALPAAEHQPSTE